MRARIVAAAAVLAALFAPACTSVDPATVAADGRALRDVPPAPYRVAVVPVTGSLTGGEEDPPLHFALSAEEFQQRLVAALRQLDAATEVFAVRPAAAGSGAPDAVSPADAAMWAGTEAGADLVIRPRVVEPPRLGYHGAGGRWPVALLLALFTGPVNAWCEASEYDARVAVEFVVESPHYVDAVATHRARVDRLDLTHWERHEDLSLASGIALLWPSMWLWDDDVHTERALSERMCQALGARLTGFLKDDLSAVQRRALGELYLEVPRNGDRVRPEAGGVPVRGKIEAGYPIQAVDVFADGESTPRARLRDAELGDATAQRRVGGYAYDLDLRLPLAAGDHELVFELVIGGQRTSRTVRLTVEEQP